MIVMEELHPKCVLCLETLLNVSTDMRDEQDI